jgi:hypothetical protein
MAVALEAEHDERFLTGLGAMFLPRSDNPTGALRSAVPGGVDGLLDAAVVGAPALGAVRDGGAFIAVLPPAAPPAERGIRVETVGVRSDGKRLGELVQLVEHGGLTLRVAQRLPFSQAAQARALFAKAASEDGSSSPHKPAPAREKTGVRRAPAWNHKATVFGRSRKPGRRSMAGLGGHRGQLASGHASTRICS